MEYQVDQPKIRLWHYLPILIMLGLAVHLLMPQITTLQNSWAVVQSMIWWAVSLAVMTEVFSYLGSGFMLHAILEINRQKLSTLKGSLITMASTSIGLVAGGWVGAAAATYGWIRRENPDRNTATLAGILPAMLNNIVLAGVALIGTVYLLIVHNLTQVQFIEFAIILLVLGLTTLGIAAALRFPEMVTKLAVRLAGKWAALRHKPFVPDKTIEWIKQFVVAWNSLHDGKWLRPVLGAIANISFDMLTLYFLFIAAGYNINLGILFVGYGLPFILGKMAFLFPGGVGVIEGSMVALYDSLHVPDDISVVVILGYRLLSFWLPTLLGFVAASYLSGKSFHAIAKQA
jgi:glycosyltransferase 2 family protein